MDSNIIAVFDKNREEIKGAIREHGHFYSYRDLLAVALNTMYRDEPYYSEYPVPDYHNIVEVRRGDYQGVILFVVPSRGYDSLFFLTKVAYGSCSACDTLMSIREYSEISGGIVESYFTLVLHMIQRMEII